MDPVILLIGIIGGVIGGITSGVGVGLFMFFFPRWWERREHIRESQYWGDINLTKELRATNKPWWHWRKLEQKIHRWWKTKTYTWGRGSI